MKIPPRIIVTLFLVNLLAGSLFAQVPAFESYFEGETHTEGDWYELPRMGDAYAGDFPYVYLLGYGWFYAQPGRAAGSGFWAYDFELGWIWTGETLFPSLYNHEWKEWYTFVGGNADRWFYNSWTGAYQVETGDPSLNLADRATAALDFAAGRLTETLAAIPVRAEQQYPGDTASNGLYSAWRTVNSSNWVSGFFPAELWVMYDWTGDPYWKSVAEERTAGLEVEKTNTTTHDIGFMLGLPYYWAWTLTGDTQYRDILLTASASLATRFSDVVGAMRSWSWGTYGNNGNFAVIIDNMMNLEMLMRTSQFEGGEQSWWDDSIDHALTSGREHMRADGSTCHVVVFDENTGNVKYKETFQGRSDTSTWSRGQAWGIYGFTVMFRETGDERFLDTARILADYFLDHLYNNEPVAVYDFDAIWSTAPRDSSASAVAASALIELSQLESDGVRATVYLNAAEEMLYRLTHPDFLAREDGLPGLLLQGSHRHNSHEQTLIYGDYYFLEALVRYLRLDVE